MVDDHVGDHLERGVARPLVDHAARLDHPARGHEVALDAPDDHVPADAEHPDRQEDPGRPAEHGAEDARDPAVPDPAVEDTRKDRGAESEQEPASGLEEGQPVAPTHEEHPLAACEQRGIPRGRVLGAGGLASWGSSRRSLTSRLRAHLDSRPTRHRGPPTRPSISRAGGPAVSTSDTKRRIGE